MPTISIENEWGASLTLTQNEHKWQVTDVAGLNPPAASISTSVIPTFDGARFNSSRVEVRNIVLTLAIVGDPETNRLALCEVVIPKRYIKMCFKNHSRDVYIEGYVETFEYNPFSQQIMAQISIICTDPYFKDLNDIVTIISTITSLFEFPFSIPEEGIALSEISDAPNYVMNSGGIQTGIIIELTSSGTVTNPTITNLTTGEYISLEETLESNELITINTQRGQKSVYKSYDSTKENIINSLSADSSWITLAPGSNQFTYTADAGSDSLIVTVKHKNQYSGV